MTNIQKRDFQRLIAVFAVGIVLILLIPMIFASCSSKGIPTLDEIKNYAEEDLESQLRGVSKEKLIEAWGKPIGTISETNACMWELDEESTLTITFNSNDKMIDSGIGVIDSNGETDLSENVDIIKADYDLSSKETLKVTDTIEKENIFIVPQSLRTNSTEITVENKSGVDVDVFLYSENDLNNPINQMTVSNGKTKSFENLTSSVIYHIGLSADTSTQLDISITD